MLEVITHKPPPSTVRECRSDETFQKGERRGNDISSHMISSRRSQANPVIAQVQLKRACSQLDVVQRSWGSELIIYQGILDLYTQLTAFGSFKPYQ